MDKLETMMEMQKQFQEKVGFNFETMTEKEKSTTKFLKKQEKLIVPLMLKNMQANMV